MSVASVNNDLRIEELLEYKEEHGDVDVPKRYEGGLGQWVSLLDPFFCIVIWSDKTNVYHLSCFSDFFIQLLSYQRTRKKVLDELGEGKTNHNRVKALLSKEEFAMLDDIGRC